MDTRSSDEVDFLPRNLADADPAPDPHRCPPDPGRDRLLRAIDIVGLDRRADAGTHVLSTAEQNGVAGASAEPCHGFIAGRGTDGRRNDGRGND